MKRLKGTPCPACGSEDTKVVVTYTSQDDDVVRFRVCGKCGKKYRTIQPPEDILSSTIVVKYYPRWSEEHKGKKVVLECDPQLT